MLTEFVRIASIDDIADGEMIDVTIEDEEICLSRIGDEFFAINNICSHFFTMLSSGELYSETYEVQCPMHDSRFNLRTGEPTCLPADKPVDTYAIRLEGRDVLVGPKESIP